MSASARRTKGGSPSYSSLLTQALSSYWVERVLFVAGSVMLVSSEQIFTEHVTKAREDVAYFERNIAQIQQMNASREHWFSEYNRSVAMRPQIRELVAQNAYELFTTTDQILSVLHAVVEHDGHEQVLSVIQEKNARRDAAARELKSGNAEALVASVNKIAPEHEQHVESLTTKLMLKRQKALSDESKWSGRLKSVQLFGTILLAVAFLLREAKEYRRKRAETKSTKTKAT